MAFNTTRLLDQITLKGCLPTGRFQDDELLALAYDVMLSELVPDIIKIRQEYYVRPADTAIVADQEAYEIESRAIGGTLRNLKLVVGSDIKDLVRVDPEKIDRVQSGDPQYFYVQGNSVILFPKPSTATGSLRQSFFMRPSKFVTVASCAAITAINTTTKTVSVTIPTGWSTSSTFDLVKGRAHYDILDYDLTATSVAGGAITFTDTLPSTLAVGDYVCLAEESCFPYMPPEGHPALIQATVAAALETIGHPAAEKEAAKAKMMKENFWRLQAVRVQGAEKSLNTRVL